MEKLDEIVKRNLEGSAYLRTWLDLPHHLKCVIAESAHEAYKISFNPMLADSVAICKHEGCFLPATCKEYCGGHCECPA